MHTKLLKKILPSSLIKRMRAITFWFQRYKNRNLSSSEYWTRHHVDAPEKGFKTSEDSLKHLQWRNNQYPNHSTLMPVDNADNCTVLDYGCGPGNDVIGFGVYSNPKKIIAIDVSTTSINLSKKRVGLHKLDVDFHKIDETQTSLPLDDNSIDIIHSAGVLHHTPNPQAILKEFSRILSKDGYIQIMVYNRNSIWMHLHVAYEMKILNKLYGSLSLESAFSRTTDGEGCPIANCYTPESFLKIVDKSNLQGEYIGSAMSLFELDKLSMFSDALNTQKLNNESHEFLKKIKFNHKNWPIYQNNVAGVNSYFRLKHIGK
jgi:ubiquinone/menaquinone biosynthesis C-methylase UbiE